MALCPKCIIGGTPIGGGGLMPNDTMIRLEFGFEPVSDGEVVGERRVVFEGEVTRGDAETGGISSLGTLVGNFGIEPDREIEQTAVLETYERDGSVVLVTVAVEAEPGRITFSANLKPAAERDDGSAFEGYVFIGQADGPMSD